MPEENGVPFGSWQMVSRIMAGNLSLSCCCKQRGSRKICLPMMAWYKLETCQFGAIHCESDGFEAARKKPYSIITRDLDVIVCVKPWEALLERPKHIGYVNGLPVQRSVIFIEEIS